MIDQDRRTPLRPGRRTLAEAALAHGYDTAFWWISGIFAVGALIAGILLSRVPLAPAGIVT